MSTSENLPGKGPWWIAELEPLAHGAGWSVDACSGRGGGPDRPVPRAPAIVELALRAWKSSIPHLARGMPAVIWRFRTPLGVVVFFVRAAGDMDVAAFDDEDEAQAFADEIAGILRGGGATVTPLVERGIPVSKGGQA